MSRSRKTSGGNSPVKKYLSFKGSSSTGKVSYYDKSLPKEEATVLLDSLDFVVLDIKSAVTGYNEKANSGVSSNLLDPYSVGKEPFVVKTKVNGSFGVALEGIWKDIKAEADTFGGKFTTVIFALADTGDGRELVRLELSGSALSPWIELINKLEEDGEDIYDKEVTISQGKLCTRSKGKTVPVTKAEQKKVMDALKKNPMADRPVWFYEPAFTVTDLSEDLAEEASVEDEKLQEYFDAAGVKSSESEQEEDVIPNTKPEPAAKGDEEDNDDLPF